jgi:hypothetical protein
VNQDISYLHLPRILDTCREYRSDSNDLPDSTSSGAAETRSHLLFRSGLIWHCTPLLCLPTPVKQYSAQLERTYASGAVQPFYPVLYVDAVREHENPVATHFLPTRLPL